MPGMRAHPTIEVPVRSDETSDLPVLRVADHAIGLWRAAEALGDPVLLEALRPLLMHVARVLARDVMGEGADDGPQ